MCKYLTLVCFLACWEGISEPKSKGWKTQKADVLPMNWGSEVVLDSKKTIHQQKKGYKWDCVKNSGQCIYVNPNLPICPTLQNR